MNDSPKIPARQLTGQAGISFHPLAEDMDQKKKVLNMGRGIFSMLAVGTLPVLFMNPFQYIGGLILCAMLALGLAFVLV